MTVSLLLNDARFLAGVSIVLGFGLLVLTYRAGWTQGFKDHEKATAGNQKLIKQLYGQIDYLQAYNDSLLGYKRAALYPTPPEMPAGKPLWGQANITPTGVTIIDKIRTSCGDPECEHCQLEKPSS